MDLQAIEARLEAATQGPWDVETIPETGESRVFVRSNTGDPMLDVSVAPHGVRAEDAEFIAHAPEDMKLLLDILEDYSDFVAELVEENHTLKYQLEQIKVAISNHPNPCSKHPEDDPVSCGWKSAYIDVVETLAC